MKAMIEIEDCRRCPFHKSYDVETPDSFDNFLDIYCRKIDSSGGKGRLICQVDGPEKALVPSWCPYIIERYKGIIEQIDSEADKHLKKHHASKITIEHKRRELISQILQELEKHSFYKFMYPVALRPTTERDNYLAVIASAVKNLINPSWIPEICTLDVEDRKIIENERATFLNDMDDASTYIIEMFRRERCQAVIDHCPAVFLKTGLVVMLVIFMADAILATTSRTALKSVELKFIDRGKDEKGIPRHVKTAELHYQSNTLKTPVIIIIAELRRILKEIFSINTLKIFVNGTQDNLIKL